MRRGDGGGEGGRRPGVEKEAAYWLRDRRRRERTADRWPQKGSAEEKGWTKGKSKPPTHLLALGVAARKEEKAKPGARVALNGAGSQ